MLNRRQALALFSSPLLAAVAGRAQAQGGAIVAPIRLEGGRVLIDVALNGQGPYPFAIDTGAVVSIVQDDLARQLKLPKLHTMMLNGKPSPIYEARDAVMGGAIRQPSMVLGGVDAPRLGARGALAAGVLTTHDSELDLDVGQWRLFPSGAPDRAGFAKLSSTLRQDSPNSSRRIFAETRVNGQGFDALLDTGMPHLLSLPHEDGVKLGLWNDATPYAPQFFSSGVSGPARARGRLVRAKRVELGPLAFDDVLAAIRPPQVEWRYAQDVIVGLPLLRAVNLSVDAVGGALWVKRNGHAPGEPGYARSGVWVEGEGKVVKIDVVGVGSPAAKAGVRVGDVVDGAGDLKAVIALLGGAAGKPVSLPLKRAGQAITAEFVLADYL